MPHYNHYSRGYNKRLQLFCLNNLTSYMTMNAPGW